jgi:hypothetical protein
MGCHNIGTVAILSRLTGKTLTSSDPVSLRIVNSQPPQAILQ